MTETAIIERHEDEGAKAFDPHLTRRLLRYLKPYRFRAGLSVFLVIVSSLFEIAGPAITAIAIDLYVKPIEGSTPIGVSARIGEWLAANGLVFDAHTGVTIAAGLSTISATPTFMPCMSSRFAMSSICDGLIGSSETAGVTG